MLELFNTEMRASGRSMGTNLNPALSCAREKNESNNETKIENK